MSTQAMTSPQGRLTIGLFFIGLGLFLSLGEVGVLDLEGLGRFWPLFVIGLGAVKVRQPLEDGQRALGVTLLFAGVLLLFMRTVSWGDAWPLGFILVGAMLLWQAFPKPLDAEPLATESPYLSQVALMGGAKRRPCMSEFRGGYITAVMGGVELDLRDARIASPTAVLDVVAVWGGIEIKVPEGWRVDGQVYPILGGFEDKTRLAGESATAPRLVVRGQAFMGGVVIDN